ncbi:MAG: LacI family DNA-binding transcriptional regulator, partial [Planctomycetota bacterium]
PVTLRMIAERLGLSVSTVSRALSGQARRYRISPQTEAAVQQLAAELHFAPNVVARGLRLRRSSSVGLIVPDIANPFFSGIADSVAAELKQAGLAVLIHDSHDDLDAEVQALDFLGRREVEGVILCPVGTCDKHLRGATAAGRPLVLVDRYFPEAGIPYVTSDSFEGAKLATEHLLERGHRVIGCLQGSPGTSPNEDRLAGYRRALEAAGVAADPALVAGFSFRLESGQRATHELLDRQPGVTALIALGNMLALGALKALAERGLRVPEDVSLICFDDHPYAPYLACPMTAVAQDNVELGRIAATWLLDELQGVPPRVRLPLRLSTRLVERQSVRNLISS